MGGRRECQQRRAWGRQCDPLCVCVVCVYWVGGSCVAVPAWACLPFSLVGRAGRGAPPSPARKELLLRQLQGFFHRLASAALGVVVCVCLCVSLHCVCVFRGGGCAATGGEG